MVTVEAVLEGLSKWPATTSSSVKSNLKMGRRSLFRRQTTPAEEMFQFQQIMAQLRASRSPFRETTFCNENKHYNLIDKLFGYKVIITIATV